MKTRTTLLAALAGAGLAVSGLGAVPALASQPQPMTLTCDGHDYTVRVSDNHSSEHGGWSVAVIQDGGSGVLIPTSFEFAAYDDTAGATLFEGTQSKGGGNANHNQQTVSCTQTMTGTLADLMDPGETPPPGFDLTDTVTLTFTATAVTKP